RSTLFPYTTLFRSVEAGDVDDAVEQTDVVFAVEERVPNGGRRFQKCVERSRRVCGQLRDDIVDRVQGGAFGPQLGDDQFQPGRKLDVDGGGKRAKVRRDRWVEAGQCLDDADRVAQ